MAVFFITDTTGQVGERKKQMSEFKAIETQEQLDAIIKERIARAQETTKKEIEEKYSDYESIKKQLSEKDTQLTELGNQLTEAKNKEDGINTKMQELQTKVQKYESDSAKTRIAQEFGIDSQLANRISGENEEEMRADAKRLKEIIGDTRWRKAPLKSNEPEKEDEKAAAYKKMLTEIKGE